VAPAAIGAGRSPAAAGGPGAARAGEEGPAAEAPSSPLPAASRDLVIQYAAARQHPDFGKPKLVLRVQDTGGQPVFVQLVERLMSSAATVYMVVFSIPKLLKAFPAHVKRVTDHLLAIAAFAENAPVLLVGTRKGDVSAAELRSVSDQLHAHIEQRCPPSVVRMALSGGGAGGTCFFAVENSKGYVGDESIRELVQALERAAARLPSMRQRVPLAWLQVYDALRRLSSRQRHASLGKVRELAEAHGMPHRGLTLEQEVASMLQFFHSLNAVLWWGDVPDLAGLVILDPQWMIDAASCFIRDFGLRDHTEGWEQMRPFDERARREEPEAWKELAQGGGVLHKCVLDILWQSQDFSDHQQELMLLMHQFGLLVPIPNKVDQYLVPALLDRLDPGTAQGPAWRALRGGPQLRVHFALAGQGRAEDQVVLDASDLPTGVAPAATFARFCTAALACGAGAAEGWVLRQDKALVTFGKQQTILAHDPENSSICVHFDAEQGGGKGIVVDFIRVLLAEDLSNYPNLRGRVLAPLPSSPGKWVDLLALPGAPAESLPAPGPSAPRRRELKEDLMFEWFTMSCDFFFVRAAKLREASDAEFPRMVTLQEMRSRFPDWIERRTIDFDSVVKGEYRDRYLAVSHRWEDPEHPDLANEQLTALKSYLVEHSEVEYVFYDFLSLPQGGRKSRTLEDNAAFYTMLSNMVFVYLGARVLVLLDYAYMGRFWTRFEAWVSMLRITEEGLEQEVEEEGVEPRCEIRCVHGAHDSLAVALREAYTYEGLRDGSAEAAVRTLSADSVQVTNGSDKSVQLGKIPLLDVMARRHALGAGRSSAASAAEELRGAAPEPPAAASAARPSRATRRVRRRAPPKEQLAQDADEPQVEGLAELLDAADLSDAAARRAWEWCREEEVTRASDVLRFEDDFVAALQLKRIPEARLRDALRELREAAGKSGGSAIGLARE